MTDTEWITETIESIYASFVQFMEDYANMMEDE